MKNHIKKEESLPPIVEDIQTTKNIPFLEEWKKENVIPYWLDGEYCLVREVKYPLDYKHGKYPLREFCQVVTDWNAEKREHPLSAKGHAASELFFFDTETTGLGGGVGNSIFILGYAQLIDDHIVLKQHILPHPGAEIPLYHSFLENIDYTTLVTYNGKAFDWPQVRTRHTLIKEHVPKLPEFGHFDLYHGARRMWKHRLERVKLQVVEEEILEVKRIDDIPGFLAPMIYYDFVETKKTEGMIGILKHNEWDILSLITLYTHISYQLLHKDQAMSAKEALEVGKWYSHSGNVGMAKETFLNINSRDTEETLMAQFLLAKQFKREKNVIDAVEAWKRIVKNHTVETDSFIVIESYIELAKFAEHKEKNIAQALDYTLAAQKLLERQPPNKKKMLELNKRMERLHNKKLIKRATISINT
ncbi:ribonuclease H-like domain-containing protein [Bacillus sp. B1-b2]|uniref:ribonuclease H-like domain-containing protein n=1 Tax=Bacillus sp. B1-b2 TaxID=2653201 RepID=UPI001D0296CC|nr:ribonuclease H-like domain-containing protein [Bacillus sp. B1-b2]